MSTELATLELPGQLSTDVNDEAVRALTSAGSFLPRLQFFSNASELVKADKFEKNHYGLVNSKEEADDLGKEVDLIPFASRPKALDFRGEQVLSYYNFNSEAFQAVHKLSSEKESKCLSGMEFLIWVPSKRVFCTFFACNISSKREAPKIISLLKKVVTFKSKYIPREKNSFTAIVVVESSAGPESLPSQDELTAEVNKFKNAKDSQVQAASTEAVAAVSGRAQ